VSKQYFGVEAGRIAFFGSEKIGRPLQQPKHCPWRFVRLSVLVFTLTQLKDSNSKRILTEEIEEEEILNFD